MARGEGSTWGLGEAAAVAAPGEREAERARRRLRGGAREMDESPVGTKNRLGEAAACLRR